MAIYPHPETPLTEQGSRVLQDWGKSEPGVSWPFWVALLIAAFVGLYTRDWGDCVIAALAAYLALAIPYMVLARRFGWRRLRVFDFVFDLVNFISG